ncbi:MAG: restriction endonuclease subunit S [Coprococcus sp.]
MGDNSKKPGIRFKGFTDDWEQRKLGDVAEFSKGSGYSKGDLVEYGTPIILYGRLYTNYETRISDVDTFVEAKVGSVYSKGGEVIVPASGETAEDIARAATVDKSGILLGGDLNIVMPNKDINSSFLAISISSGNPQRELAKKAQGKSVVHIHNEEIKNLVLPFPIKDEQNKIASYFCQLDNLITLHQRKYDKLVMSKKSMLEKMFPKNGQTKPEIRFSGFIDDWEQRKLGELGSLKNGMNFSKKAMGIGFPFVNLQNIFGNNVIDVSNLGKAMASDSQLKDYNLLNGDVLFVRSSVKLEGVGEAALVPQTLDNTTYSGFIIRFRDEYGLDNNFKRFVFGIESVRNQIMSQATNSANKNISQSVLENLELAIPSKSEQQKIGAYFSNLDHLITLHQRELEKLKKIKLSMLEKMFV